MKVDSKKRLFEVFNKVNKLNETTLSVDDKNNIVNGFVDYVDSYIGLNNNVPEIDVDFENSDAKEMKSFGGYIPNEFRIKIVGVNRNLADVLRTLAHELVHHKQNIENRLNQNSGNTGSEEENEANSLAGIILRNFGKNNPIIYE